MPGVGEGVSVFHGGQLLVLLFPEFRTDTYCGDITGPDATGVTREFSYPVTLSPEIKSAFTVTFPDIPEAITSGRNREEAFTQAADCLAFALAGRVRDGSDIQESSRRKGAYMIQVP
ncbi:MAG: type II toxin-antitoxin system HicB family antitoxin, partial [Acidobacteriota bacterium]|nr:type II toxin-antitoxin system HicB family antitoxin [Acidobacteriota bacterium]